MNVFDAIDTRISVPAWTDPGPTDTQWEILLRAGARAPDHDRLQPGRFLIVRGAAREMLRDVMAEALRATKPDTPLETLARERRKFSRAPALLGRRPCPAFRRARNRANPGGGAAVQNILLAAHALGLAAIWRTGAPAFSEDVARALGLSSPSSILARPMLRQYAAPPPGRRAP